MGLRELLNIQAQQWKGEEQWLRRYDAQIKAAAGVKQQHFERYWAKFGRRDKEFTDKQKKAHEVFSAKRLQHSPPTPRPRARRGLAMPGPRARAPALALRPLASRTSAQRAGFQQPFSSARNGETATSTGFPTGRRMSGVLFRTATRR